MNMDSTIAPAPDELPWSCAASEINAWRGECIQSFARAEAAVTETLLTLGDVAGRGRAVQLRHLIGQRLEDLAMAIGPDGDFAEQGAAASEALAAFRLHEELRSHLAHDVARIALERNGSWVVVFRRLAIRSRQAERSTVAFEQAHALDVLGKLKRSTQRLEAALTHLRRSIQQEQGYSR